MSECVSVREEGREGGKELLEYLHFYSGNGRGR